MLQLSSILCLTVIPWLSTALSSNCMEVKSIQHFSVAKGGAHFSWEVIPQMGLLVHVDYQRARDVVNRYAIFPNVVLKLSRPAATKTTNNDSCFESGRKPIVHFEKKSLFLMKYLVQKFSKLGSLNLNAFYRMLSKAKVWLLLQK